MLGSALKDNNFKTAVVDVLNPQFGRARNGSTLMFRFHSDTCRRIVAGVHCPEFGAASRREPKFGESVVAFVVEQSGILVATRWGFYDEFLAVQRNMAARMNQPKPAPQTPAVLNLSPAGVAVKPITHGGQARTERRCPRIPVSVSETLRGVSVAA